MAINAPALCGDDLFGPAVKSADCRGGFDFTVLFEESILTILPAACFIFLVPFRILRLARRRLRVRRNTLYGVKLATIVIYAALQIAALALAIIHPVIQAGVSTAAAAISLVSALTLVILSHLEHTKSIRPSSLISVYLLATVIFDAARVRTQWLRTVPTSDAPYAGVLTASLTLKCAILILEAVEKRSLLFGLDRKVSRESTSGLLSRSTFWWLNGLLLSGFRHVLTLEALPEIYEKLDSTELASRLELAWEKRDQTRKHALALACIWSLRWDVLVIYVPRLLYAALSISQVYLIQDVVAFVESKSSDSTGYGLLGGFAFVYVGLAVTMGWSTYLSYRLMTMLRGQLTSVIYSKMLTLPAADATDSSAMSLMGTDVQRIAESFFRLIVETIPSFLQVVVAVYLLYLQLGVVCVAPVIVTIVSTGLSVLLAGHVTSRQGAWLAAVQRRINFTSEILKSMRSVKMLGLETQMSTNIEDLRTSEIASSKRYRRVQSLNVALINLPNTFSSFCIFAAYAIISLVQGTNGMSVSQAITSLAALSLLGPALGTLLIAIPEGWAALGCFTRIQTYLLEESRTEKRQIGSMRVNNNSAPGLENGFEMEDTKGRLPNSIIVTQGSFGWSETGPDVVKDVNISLDGSAQCTILVGPIGCGKSTFLKGLLGETSTIQGRIEVSSPEMAFCDQTAWIINGSIRDNIIAESSKLDAAWYATVCRACALDFDLRQLPAGDATVVGSKGVKLSGGQRQRISVARTIYARPKLAVFDDVLSGLDAVTEGAVFQGVFGRDGLLRQLGTTVILATHSVKHLAQADLILVLNHEGRIVEQGKFVDLNVPGSYIHDLQIEFLEKDETSGQSRDDEPAQVFDRSMQPLVDANKAELNESRKTGDWTTYKYYARALGPWYLFLFFSFVAANHTCFSMSSIWLNWWAEDNESGNQRPLGYWLGMYGLLCVMNGTFMVAAIAFLWIVMIPRSAKNLHQSILKAVSRAPLSFFSETETGVLVNRFSQDLRHVDMSLPGALINCGFQLGSCIGAVALAINAVGYFALVLPFVLLVLYAIQKFYLRTSRQLRLLELETSAPLYSHFIETLAGLTTIRAFAWSAAYTRANHALIGQSQKPYYLLLCIQRWLVFVLDLVVAGLAVVLVGMAIALRARMNPGFLGVALVTMTDLSHALTNLVQYWTMLETSLGAVARIRDFARDTPVEEGWELDGFVEETWPARGEMKFEGVCASYGHSESPVLKNISLSVGSRQKIGIVGRTGSGKSSSILAILRLINIGSGRILFDDTDLATMPGPTVRDHVTCLTQEPFLFPASVRSNLDPQGRSTDEAMVGALQKVGLWDVLQAKAPSRGSQSSVLDMLMDSEILSHGQRQLFCLARAMLKNGSVLILDEPTSSMDQKTDLRMQALIRSEFNNHTIIMIAHRLSSLLDFDRVAVLDEGNLVEFGNPTELLKDGSSHFAKLYNSSISA
ncbi:unnamed protein product [Discula destructiva]